jgi:hypothetical protein
MPGASSSGGDEVVGPPYLREIIDAGRHPHFARRVIEADDPNQEHRFEFGLCCLLTGIAAELAAR